MIQEQILYIHTNNHMHSALYSKERANREKEEKKSIMCYKIHNSLSGFKIYFRIDEILQIFTDQYEWLRKNIT